MSAPQKTTMTEERHVRDDANSPAPGTITRLLKQAHAGDEDALAQVWDTLYLELRKVAHRLIQGDALRHQVDATELIGEIWMRGRNDKIPPVDRQQFFARAFRHMARELIDQSRKRDARKRGGDWSKRPLDVVVGELRTIPKKDGDQRAEAEELMLHWERLNETSPECGSVAFCRMVLGLRNDETASALELDPKRAKQHWDYAKAKLRHDMRSMKTD